VSGRRRGARRGRAGRPRRARGASGRERGPSGEGERLSKDLLHLPLARGRGRGRREARGPPPAGGSPRPGGGAARSAGGSDRSGERLARAVRVEFGLDGGRIEADPGSERLDKPRAPFDTRSGSFDKHGGSFDTLADRSTRIAKPDKDREGRQGGAFHARSPRDRGALRLGATRGQEPHLVGYAARSSASKRRVKVESRSIASGETFAWKRPCAT
jgi:hypothetical protein